MTSRDTWQLDAAHRLRKHLMRAVITGKNFAPDTTLELMKAGKVGPLSAQISEIFQRHADGWAACMRATNGHRPDQVWQLSMVHAEDEIGRFIAGHKLTTGAAA